MMTEVDYFYGSIESPLGLVHIRTSLTCVTNINFGDDCFFNKYSNRIQIAYKPPVMLEALEQIHAYFYKSLKSFNLPLVVLKTSFTQLVYQCLQDTHYGETISYQAIAIAVGSPKACQAVGLACKRNPILLAVPCHRVLNVSGELTGFSAGITRKQKLLYLESNI